MNETILSMSNKDTDVISFEVPTPFPVGPVNLYLLIGNKITLVDTGPKTEVAWKSFIYQLNKNGFRIKDIDQVILTHHHVDHSGLLSILSQYHPKLKIYAHKATIPWIERRVESIKELIYFYKDLYEENGLSANEIETIKNYHNYFNQYFDPVYIDGSLEDGDTVEGNTNWKVIHTPGHSQGHISLYNKQTKTLIAGDHLIENLSSGTFIEPPVEKNRARPKSLVDFKRSLERIRKMDIEQVYSGHGKVIDQPMEIIDNYLSRLNHRAEKIKDLLTEKPMTVYEAMMSAYPDRYHKNLPLFFSEILGTLDLLEVKGEASSIRENGLIRYYLKSKVRQ